MISIFLCFFSTERKKGRILNLIKYSLYFNVIKLTTLTHTHTPFFFICSL